MLSHPSHDLAPDTSDFLDTAYEAQAELVLAGDVRALHDALEPQETRLVSLYQACLDRAGKADSLDEALRWIAQAQTHARQREATDEHQESHWAKWVRHHERARVWMQRHIGRLDAYATAISKGFVQGLVRWSR
jgi:hypothetical protein